MSSARSVFIASLLFVPTAASSAALNPQPASTQQAAFSFPADAEIRDFIQAYVDSGQAKGIVVGLLNADGTRRVITAGDSGEGAQPLGPQSIFEIGSINKTFTGTLLADMVRKGEVSLDDPVAKYLPDTVKVPARNGKQITLLDLATHSSGLPRLPTGYQPPDRSNPYAHFAESHLYEFLNRHELERDPGEKPEYSNLGMGLLGHALTRAAKAPSFAALVEQRILKPLGMRHTGYGRPPEFAALLTKGHDEDGKVVPYWDVGVLAGAGGLSSNANDMLTYVAANVGPPESSIEQAMREAQRGHRPGSGPAMQMGLGWMSFTQDGRTSLGHGGGTAGYSTFIGLDPARNAAVVVLSNSGDFDYADFIGRKLLEPGWKQSIALPASDLQAYVGTYRLREGLDLAVTLEKGRLFGQATGQPKLPLFAAARDRLFLRAIEAELTFDRDAAGKVTGATLHQKGRQLTGPRIG